MRDRAVPNTESTRLVRPLLLGLCIWALLTLIYLTARNSCFLFIEYRASHSDTAVLLIDDGAGFRSERELYYSSSGVYATARLPLPKIGIEGIRLMPSIAPGYLDIRRIYVTDSLGSIIRQVDPNSIVPLRETNITRIPGGGVRLAVEPRESGASRSDGIASPIRPEVDLGVGRLILTTTVATRLLIGAILGAYVLSLGWCFNKVRRRWREWLDASKALPLSIAASAVCSIVLAVIVTHATLRFRDAEWFNEGFNEIAMSLVQGRVYLPAGSFSAEGIDIDGHRTAYFGIWPAIFRILLFPVVPLWNNAGKIPMALAIAAYLAGAVWIAVQLWTHRPVVLRRNSAQAGDFDRYLATVITATALGSSLLIIGGRGYLYHEALAWGVAGATIGIGAAMQMVRLAGGSTSLIFGLAALACAHSRVPTFVGLCLVTGVLAVAALASSAPKEYGITKAAWARAFRLAGILGVVAGSLLLLNLWRFGDWTTFMPLAYHYGHPLERLAHFGVATFWPSNIPDRMERYFAELPTLSATFPFISFSTTRVSNAHDDIIEPYVNFLFANLGLISVLAVGLTTAAFYRRHRQLLLAALASLFAFVPVLGFVGVTVRYAVELVPALTILACLAAAASASRGVRYTVLWAILPLGCATVLLLGMRFQGEIVWGIPKTFSNRYAYYSDKTLRDVYINPASKGVDLVEAGLTSFEQMHEFVSLGEHQFASRFEAAPSGTLYERNLQTNFGLPLQRGNCFLYGNDWLYASRSINNDFPWYAYPYSIQASCAPGEQWKWDEGDKNYYNGRGRFTESMQWIARTVIIPVDASAYVRRFRDSMLALCEARKCQLAVAPAASQGVNPSVEAVRRSFALDCRTETRCTWYRAIQKSNFAGAIAGSLIKHGDLVFFAYSYEPSPFTDDEVSPPVLERLAKAHESLLESIRSANKLK